MNDMVQTYEVKILGVSYTLVTDEPEDLIKRSAYMVDELLSQASENKHGHDFQRASILALVRLASQLLQREQDIKKAEITSAALAMHIEQALSALTVLTR